jgi:molybdopterin converting factor small subunit
MPLVRFTANIQRHVRCPDHTLPGSTIRDVLNSYFSAVPSARNYVLDEQDSLRHHMAIFVNGKQIRDRRTLSDSVSESDTIDVMQALSGG